MATRRVSEKKREYSRAYGRARWASLSAEQKMLVRENQRAYRAANKDKVKAWKESWRARNPEKYKEMHRRSKARIRATSEGALNRRIRENIKESFKFGTKVGNLEKRLGYTMADLKRHLERQFTKGMTWENRGQFGWHIDHIIPLSSFKFTSMDDPDFKAAWALSNLRPMWWAENIRKGGKRLHLL